MASIIGVETLQHTNSTTAATIDSSGVITANAGFKLGTGTDILNSYEEGTFTPTMGSGSGSITSQSNSGFYVKIGGICFIYMDLTLTDKGSASGTLTVSGLPFASALGTRQSLISRENATTGVLEQFMTDHNASTGFFKSTGGGNVSLANGNRRFVTGVYKV
jgi:hypothetical protein